MRFLWLGVKIPSALTDVSMVQFTTTMADDNLKWTDVYNSGAKIRRSVIVRRTTYQELWKCLYVNCCNFFYAEDFVGRNGNMLNFTPLWSPDIFNNHASISQKGKILRWSKHVGQQADLVSVHCLQTNEKPRDKIRIHLGCSTTHDRAKLVPHWIPQSHQTFSSSASSKTKTDKKFSWVFVRTWKKAKAKLVNNKSYLAIKTTNQEQFSSVACMSLSFKWNHTTIHITCDNWRWILIRDDRNLSMHRRELMRFKNGFSLLS